MANVPLRHLWERCAFASLLGLGLSLIGCVPSESNETPPESRTPISQGRAVPPSATVTLADQGVAQLTIRVPFDLSAVPRPSGALRTGLNLEESWTQDQRIRVTAEDLASMLNHIVCGDPSCGTFTIARWSGPQDDANSILVGRPEDFGMDPASAGFVPVTPLTREQHLIRTTSDGVLLLGGEAIGVEAAVWDFLHEVGYRFFIPQKNWEIIPHQPDLQLNVDKLLGPSPGIAPGMVARKFSAPSSARSEDPAWSLDHNNWRTRNGVRRALEISDTHSWYAMYSGINQTSGWFDDNPGALATGSWEHEQVTQPKFCNDYTDSDGNVLTDVIYDRWLQARLNGSITDFASRDAVMVEPSDGPGWNACAPGTAGGGTPSDRMVNFAQAMKDRRDADPSLPPDHPKLLQFYAYSYHSQPPAHSALTEGLFPLAANGYIRGGYTVEELIDGWYAAGAEHVGIFDYWVHNGPQLPGRGGPAATRMLAGDLRRRIVQHGAMALQIDADGGWGTHILPYYTTILVAKNPDVSVAGIHRDFFRRAFPDRSKPHVQRWFQLIDGDDQEVLLGWDLVREMYSTLHAARGASQDPEVLSRIEDLLIYTRHTQLYLRYLENNTPGLSRVDLLDSLFEHAFQTRNRRMTAWRALYLQPWGGDRAQLEQRHASALTSSPYPGCAASSAAQDRLFMYCRNNHDQVWADVEPSPSDLDAWIAEGLAIPATPGADRILQRRHRPIQEALVVPGQIPTTGGARGLGGHSRFWSMSTSNVDVTSQYDDNEWMFWIDPAEGISFTDTCAGLLDSQIKSSRALGPVRVSLSRVSDDGRQTFGTACTFQMPPDKRGRMIVLNEDCAGSDCYIGPDTLTSNPQCEAAPVGRILDTGVDLDEPDLGLGSRYEPTASCTNHFTEPGMYRLKVENLNAGVRLYWPPANSAGTPPVHAVRFDSPSLQPRHRMPLQIASSRFFYVPDGTDRFLFWHDGSADCRIFRGSNTASSIDPPDMPGFYEVDTLGHDGTVWQARQCTRMYLFDPIPPYTSAWPEDLMVPCSLIESSPADAALLGLPTDACSLSSAGDTGLPY